MAVARHFFKPDSERIADLAHAAKPLSALRLLSDNHATAKVKSWLLANRNREQPEEAFIVIPANALPASVFH